MSKNLLFTISVFMLNACDLENVPRFEIDLSDEPECEGLPRPEHSSINLSSASDDWFEVYEVADGVYSIVEPFQWQQTVSHLIVGDEQALLFDTGIGLLPIRPVVERITDLPVSVLNSHTHYDHTGGNHEFSSVLAIDSEYTRANMAGFGSERIAEDFTPDSFCRGIPAGTDPASFHTREWTAVRFVADGDVLDLGGRSLEILQVPGHTPDGVALMDSENRLLFTGDTYYADRLWLWVKETSLDDYEQSISRLSAIEGDVDYLFGAHTIVRVDANRLAQVQAAFDKLRNGEFDMSLDDQGRVDVEIDGVKFLTSQEALAGKQGDQSKGGSGLDAWPQVDR